MKTIIEELKEEIWDLSFKISYNAALLKEDYYTESDKENLRNENLRLTEQKSKRETLVQIFEQKRLN